MNRREFALGAAALVAMATFRGSNAKVLPPGLTAFCAGLLKRSATTDNCSLAFY